MPSGKGRRTLAKEKALPEYRTLINLIHTRQWPYKTSVELLRSRDEAILCTLAVTGLRVGELVQVRKAQFEYEPGEYAAFRHVKSEKHSFDREEIPIPLIGPMSQFLSGITDWVDQVPSREDFLFPSAPYGRIAWQQALTPNRINQIVLYNSGHSLYPHRIRAMLATHLGKSLDAWELSEFFGWRRIEMTRRYVRRAKRWIEKMEQIA